MGKIVNPSKPCHIIHKSTMSLPSFQCVFVHPKSKKWLLVGQQRISQTTLAATNCFWVGENNNLSETKKINGSISPELIINRGSQCGPCGSLGSRPIFGAKGEVKLLSDAVSLKKVPQLDHTWGDDGSFRSHGGTSIAGCFGWKSIRHIDNLGYPMTLETAKYMDIYPAKWEDAMWCLKFHTQWLELTSFYRLQKWCHHRFRSGSG